MKHRHFFYEIMRDTVRRQPVLSMLLVVTIIGTIVAGILPPLVLGEFVDSLAMGSSPAVAMAVLYFVLLMIAGVFDAAKEALITVFGQKVTRGLRSSMTVKLSRLPASYLVKNEPGVITSKIVNDVNTVESLFTSGVISMVVDACKVISILGVIFWKSRGLGVILIVVTPLLWWMTRTFQKRMLTAQRSHRVAVGETSKQIPETLESLRTIQVFHKEKYMEHRYAQSVKKSFRAMEQANFYDAIYSPIILTISAVVVAVMMELSGSGEVFMAYFGMSAGTAVAIISYVGKVFEPLESIGMEIQNIQSAVAGMGRIQEFLSEEEMESAADESRRVDGSALAVELAHVSFGYEEEQNILDDFSLQVNKGERVTLMGRTGVGKSTLFKLLLGLYQPRTGEVTIQGRGANQIPDEERRKVFGYVEQNFQMIEGTIGEQISLKDPNITRTQIERAIRLVGLEYLIMGQSEGIDTPCQNSIFSQGQLQLLSIARAIVAEPEILLLDEITANLDSMTERQVLDALEKASKGRTVISISHRLYEQSGGRKVILE